MIKDIQVHGLILDYIYVHKNYPGFPTHGQEDNILVRWNNSQDRLEGFINNSWQALGYDYSITFTQKFEDSMNWIQNKMAEEKRIEEVINKYPEIKKLKEQLDIMVHLVRRHEDEPNS